MQKTVQTAFLLDVDGVVTDPDEKKVTQRGIFEHLEKQLTAGNVVALNTGRSNEWMIERVINPLASRLKDKSPLKYFYAVGEKGLTWASFDGEGNLIQGVYDRDGKPVEGFDLSVFLEPETVEHFKALGKEAQSLIAQKYSHSTFFDTTKKAMVSTEKIDGFDQTQFSKEQSEFTKALKDMIQSLGLEGKFNVDPTTIATDIQIPEAGKDLGAQRIIDRLKSLNIEPANFITVGDSESDAAMADHLSNNGMNVEFVFVGKRLDITRPYPIIKTAKTFSEGTLEYLNSR